MATDNPTLSGPSPALQCVRQSIIAFVDCGAIQVHDIPGLCMHVARLDAEGRPPGLDWMRHLAEFLPGAFMMAAEGINGSVSDLRAMLERRALSAELLLKAIGSGMMRRVNDGEVPNMATYDASLVDDFTRPPVDMGKHAFVSHFAPPPGHWRTRVGELQRSHRAVADALVQAWQHDVSQLHALGLAATAIGELLRSDILRDASEERLQAPGTIDNAYQTPPTMGF